VEVRVGDHLYIFDCGTGFRVLGQALRREFGNRPVSAHIFVSHFHWDHIQGLPFFGPLYDNPENRFEFHCSSRTRSLKQVFEEQMASPYFPVGLHQMLEEHKAIVAALNEFSSLARKEKKMKYVRFADRLMVHAMTEEEVLYPTAIVIGDYIKLKLGKSVD